MTERPSGRTPPTICGKCGEASGLLVDIEDRELACLYCGWRPVVAAVSYPQRQEFPHTRASGTRRTQFTLQHFERGWGLLPPAFHDYAELILAFSPDEAERLRLLQSLDGCTRYRARKATLRKAAVIAPLLVEGEAFCRAVGLRDDPARLKSTCAVDLGLPSDGQIPVGVVRVWLEELGFRWVLDGLNQLLHHRTGSRTVMLPSMVAVATNELSARLRAAGLSVFDALRWNDRALVIAACPSTHLAVRIEVKGDRASVSLGLPLAARGAHLDNPVYQRPERLWRWVPPEEAADSDGRVWALLGPVSRVLANLDFNVVLVAEAEAG